MSYSAPTNRAHAKVPCRGAETNHAYRSEETRNDPSLTSALGGRREINPSLILSILPHDDNHLNINNLGNLSRFFLNLNRASRVLRSPAGRSPHRVVSSRRLNSAGLASVR